MCPQPLEPSRPGRPVAHSRHAGPVFVDQTGQRHRRVAGLGVLATLPALAFAATLGFSVLDGPPVDRLSLPSQQREAQAAHLPAEAAAAIGIRDHDRPESRGDDHAGSVRVADLAGVTARPVIVQHASRQVRIEAETTDGSLPAAAPATTFADVPSPASTTASPSSPSAAPTSAPTPASTVPGPPSDVPGASRGNSDSAPGQTRTPEPSGSPTHEVPTGRP